MTDSSRTLLLALSLAGTTGACVGTPPTAPSARASFATTEPPEGMPTIVTLAHGHPDFLASSVSFWAKAGADREGIIYFADSTDRRGRGEAFVRLRIRSRSLLAYPDGRAFLPGDSVLITMRVVDPDQILFEMQPSGLRFSSTRPAELKIEYLHADPDYNHDSTVDAEDASIQHALAIWQQEEDGGPFVPLGSVNLEDQQEIFVSVFGFSRFAIAY